MKFKEFHLKDARVHLKDARASHLKIKINLYNVIYLKYNL